jgi:predicted Zn-dependent protease
MKKLHGISLVVLSLMLSACASTVTQAPSSTRVEIEAEQKKQEALAEAAKAEQMAQAKTRHAKALVRMNGISERIAKAGLELCTVLLDKKKTCAYQFELKDSDELNAFADGHKVVITTAMVEFFKTDQELATVLGHELAHNMLGHQQAMSRNVYTGAITGALVDVLAASQGIDTGYAFAKTGAEASNLVYSPDFESEADYVGLYIAARAGYPVDEASGLWRKMAVKNSKAIYISTTHPTSAERFLSLEKTAKEIKAKQEQGVALIPERKDNKVAQTE